MDYTTVTEANHDGEPIITINWDDGRWWQIKSEMPYGVRRRISQAAVPMGERVKDLAGDGEVKLDSDLNDLVGKIADITIEGCSVAWSWNAPITAEEIWERPEHCVNTVLDLMRATYGMGGRPDEAKKDSPSRSGQKSRSPKSSRRRSTTGSGSGRA